MALPSKLQGLRKKALEEAVAHAKQKIAENLTRAKASGRIGHTTAQDDIGTVNQIINTLAVGLGVAIDTDANPRMVLQSLQWKEFKELFPHDLGDLVAHIPELERKLPTPKNILDQEKACFFAAKEALEEALLVRMQYPPFTWGPTHNAPTQKRNRA